MHCLLSLTLIAVTSLLAVPCRPARAEALLAYAEGSTIYTASAVDGKHRKQICAGDDPCISSDGRLLAYTRTERAAARSPRTRRGGDDAAVRVIVVRELATDKETVLPTEGQPAFGALWSPDGQWLAMNAYNGKNWQVAAIHPDGTNFHILTRKLDPENKGFFLSGWNMHEGAVLTQNLDAMAQIDPKTGEVMWHRPIKELTGEDSASSDLRCTISGDGRLLVSTRYVVDDEFKNLDGPSSYLVLKDFPDGAPRRVTPVKFDVSRPWLDFAGQIVFFRGFTEKDVTTLKGSDGLKLKLRIYRYDIRSGKFSPLIEGGETPSVSCG